jgi:hypothetical protein
MNITDDIALQRLWMSLERTPWHALAVVPGASDASALSVASSIAEVSWHSRGDATVVLDLRRINFRLVDYYKKEISERVKKGESVILALSSIDDSPTQAALARAADAAVLVVSLRETSMKAAERAIDEIGRDRFLGAIVMDGAR